MTPQDQEFTSKPEIGQYDDCQRAVIASLLDLPIADVPHFLQEAKGDAEVFWQLIVTFLAWRGLAYIEVDRGWWTPTDDKMLPIYHQISGPSPRGNGLHHAIVGRNGMPFFDPHPSRAMLAGNAGRRSFRVETRLLDQGLTLQLLRLRLVKLLQGLYCAFDCRSNAFA